MSRILNVGKKVLAALALIVLTIYFVLAFTARSQADLGSEHRIRFQSEFRAAEEDDTDWRAYVEREDRLAAELEEFLIGTERQVSLVDRYSRDSLTYPGSFDGNWNRSFEIRAPAPRGVAVLLHGLTDSPYSMLATAEALVASGYSVVVPRMPGHGFAVGGMLQARWEDWSAAVRVAVRHAQQLPGAEHSLLLGGYSNGGLLAVHYALECDEREGLNCPDGLVLFSPSIAVSKLAVLTNLHAGISWLPYFEKFKWQTVLPEIDPFKFTSFPKRAAWEIRRILSLTHAQLADPTEVAKLPPVLTFQSAVDGTVSAGAIITLLYNRLPANDSRLVVYGVNSNSTMLHLMRGKPVDPAKLFQSAAPLSYDAVVLQNHDTTGRGVDAWMILAGESDATLEPTRYAWPDNVFSLSHIALPFRADDLVYGDGARPEARARVILGALSPRGERRVMRLNAEYFLRMRYNPFFGFQQAQLIDWLDALPGPTHKRD